MSEPQDFGAATRVPDAQTTPDYGLFQGAVRHPGVQDEERAQNDAAAAARRARPAVPLSEDVLGNIPVGNGYRLHDIVGAAFRTENSVGSTANALLAGADVSSERQPGYSAWKDIQGTPYEHSWEIFADSPNPAVTAMLKRRVDREIEDHRTLDGTGAAGWIAAVGAGIADPTNLIPVGGELKLIGEGTWSISKSALSAARAGAIGAALQESVLQNTQETRTLEEGAINIGSGALLAGLLGGSVAGLLGRAEAKQGAVALENIVRAAGQPSSVGAAGVERATLGDLSMSRAEGFGGAAEAVAKASQAISPNLQAQFSPSAAVREVSQGLAENTLFQTMHDTGRTLGAAAETNARVTFDARSAVGVRQQNAIFSEMKKAGINLSREDFEQAIGQAMARGDQHENSFVARAAEAWRKNFFDPFQKDALHLGLLNDEDVVTKTAESYLPRLYLREALVQHEGVFKDRVSAFYEQDLQARHAQAVDALDKRKTALEQELADLRMSPEERANTLNDLEGQGAALDAAHPKEVDHVSTINDLRRQKKAASDAGDSAAVARLQAAIDGEKAAGGERLQSYLADRKRLRARRNRVDLNYAGLADRETSVLNSLADIEEASATSLNRLVDRGRALERDIQRLDPAKRQVKISDLRTSFIQTAERADAALDRQAKALTKLDEKAKADAAAGKTADVKLQPAAHGIGSFEVLVGGQRAGDFVLAPGGQPFVDRVEILPGFRRQGVANEAYRQAEARIGRRLVPSPLGLTAESTAFHKNRLASMSSAEAVSLLEEARAIGRTFKISDEHLDARLKPLDEAARGLRTTQTAARKRIEKEIAAQRNRSDRMNRLAARLEAAESLDIDASLIEVRQSVDELVREVSSLTLSRGEKAQRLKDRLASLDPKKVDVQVKAREEALAGLDRQFDERWRTHLDEDGVGFTGAARGIADDVWDKLTNRKYGEDGIDTADLRVPLTRGPLKDRTFNVPDALIEDFLERNVMTVAERYGRTMSGELELTRKFGRADMRDQLQAIKDDYRSLRAALDTRTAPTPEGEAALTEARDMYAKVTGETGTPENRKLKSFLDKREKLDVKNVEAMRDMIRGTYMGKENATITARVIRGLQSYNYIRAMGGLIPSNLSDLYRPAMVHGLRAYLAEGVMPFLTNLKAVKMSVEDARTMGLVTEMMTQHRLMSMGEMGDPYRGGTAVEKLLSNGSRVGSRWNGIAMLTDFTQGMSATLSQNRILKGVTSGQDARLLAYLGIDAPMAARIAEQFKAHGETHQTLHIANTAQWVDEEAVRAYRAAVRKDVDSIIVNKSVGDLPLLANHPIGKAIVQFRTYAIASHQRVLLRGMQESKRRFVSGMVAMTALGMLSTALAAWRGGADRWKKFEQSATNPGYLIGEGLDRSGLFALPVEVGNEIEVLSRKGLGVSLNPIKAPLLAAGKLANPNSSMQGDSIRFSNRGVLGAVGGPTVGLLDEGIWRGGQAAVHAAQGKFAKKDARALQALVPFGSYAGMKEMLQAISGDSPYAPDQ